MNGNLHETTIYMKQPESVHKLVGCLTKHIV